MVSKKYKILPPDIQEKLARLDAFTTLNPRPVIEIDFQGDVLDENESAKRLFPDLKRKGPKHIYLSDLEDVIKFLLKEKIPFRRDIKIGEKWYKQIFYYIPQFKLIHIYGSDATERKTVEKKLKESEKLYHVLFEKMNYAYALQDILFDKKGKPTDYKFVDINPAFEKLFKLKRENIIKEAGFDFYLTKPVNISDLISVLADKKAPD